MAKYKYFTDEEVLGLKDELALKLDQMRFHAGIPIIITCGIRTPDGNNQIGGVHDSAHLTGEAADIHCADSHSRLKLISSAIMVGFVRIGDETHHIHVDISKTLPQNVMWVGESH